MQCGWINNKAEQARVQAILAATQGYLDVTQAAPHLKGTGAGKDVFFWELEQKVFGRVLPSWDQSSIGSCVSHGWGRASQDTLLVQICRDGSAEIWPGAEVCREAIYGGSRIEIGHSPGGEGSVGAWAAQWVSKWGLLLYLKYGSTDLTGGYSVQRCRQWGDRGVPDDLEPEARKHPVKGVALVRTPEEVFDMIAAYKPVAICGETSRPMKRSPGGWCPKTGNEWPHCEEIRGTGVIAGGSNSPFGGDGAAPYAGDVQAFVEQNSWGDYLGSDYAEVTLASGRKITLPQGCYLSHPEDRVSDLREGDSFALSDATAWDSPKFSWQV